MTSSLELSATGESRIPQDVTIEALDTVSKLFISDNAKLQSNSKRYNREKEDAKSVKQV
jgi:hypothetical protein